MKTVFSNSEVCHVFAHQTQQRGRNSSESIFFEGKTIYSYGYHFPMARFITNKNGDSIVLLNSDSYSPTTSDHQAQTRSALDHYDLLHVPTEVIKSYDNGFDPDVYLKNTIDNYKDLVKKLDKARKPELYINQLQRLQKQLNDVLDNLVIRFDKRKNRALWTFVKNFSSAGTFDPKHYDGYTQSVLDGMKRRDREKKKFLKSVDECQTYILENHFDKWMTFKQDHAWRRTEQGIFSESISLHSKFKPDVSSHAVNNLRDKITLELIPDAMVRTSRGAELSLNMAKKMYRIVKYCRDNKTPHADDNFNLGRYRGLGVDIKGNLTSGCHYIHYIYIEHFAKSQGWA